VDLPTSIHRAIIGHRAPAESAIVQEERDQMIDFRASTTPNAKLGACPPREAEI